MKTKFFLPAILSCVLCVLSVFQVCHGQIIHIPTERLTIQEGIVAASDGDTVLVADGTYFENINFLGKSIIVASHIILDGDTNHIINTVIDGSQNPDPDNGTVVTFNSGEDTTACLTGFTIKGGTGTFVPYIFPVRTGGGIFFFNAGGKLERNIILNNECILDTLNGSVSGGGIASGPHGTEYMLVIRNNIIRNNRVWTKGENTSWDRGWAQGGAIYLCFNAIIERNTIDSNICKSDEGISTGGAIRMIADQTDTVFQILAEIRENIFAGNESISGDYDAFAGGISCSAANLILKNNRITGNKVETQTSGKGAGIYIDLINAYSAEVEGNYIQDNYTAGQNVFGGAIGLFRSRDIKVVNNVIENNAAVKGGAFSINGSQTGLICNNTILNNTAEQEGGAFYIYSSSAVEILNSILWNDQANGLPDEIFLVPGSSVTVSYTDLQTGWTGEGNFSQEPLFLGSGNDPFQLAPDSPCIDTGIPDTTGLFLPQQDIMGNLRILDGNGDQVNNIDIGAYEFDAGAVGEGEAVQSAKLKVQSYPNPAEGIVGCRLSTVDFQWVSLKIYDVQGREVANVFEGELPAGEHDFTVDVSAFPAGIYLLRLTACPGKERRGTSGQRLTVTKKLVVKK